MSNGISQFAYTAPAPTASFGLAGPSGPTGGTSGGSLSVDLPEISVGPEPDLGGGALPGDGSYGDPIAGFHQINGQFADSQRAFSERMDAQSAQFNTQMQAQSDARAAQMQAQFESNMASMNAQHAAMFAPPPVTGPILPPNFSETAQVPAAPAPALPAAAPAADPFAATGEGGLGLSPVGTTGLTAFGLGGPAPGATPNLAFDPAPLGQGGIDAAPPAQPAPPPIGYGDQPLGVPVSQISRLTSADAQAAVGARLDAFGAAATPAAQDAALQDALNGAYAFRVQGGDAGPFDRIAERVAGDPRAEVELKVARDRAEAIVAAGVSGNIRALNDNGVNFGAQLYALQRSVTNDPDNALGPIGRALDGLRYGEGAGSAVNDIQAGATRQALTGLGFGREVQDATALDAARTEAAQIQQRQALAAMTPAERLSYIAGQAADAGLAGLGGLALGMTGLPARFGNTLSNDYKGTFFGANPGLEGRVVVHHAVEQQTLKRYPGIVTPGEMHSLENLRGIPNGVNSQLHLSQIRREWNQFYRQNPAPTKQQLLDKATDIDNRYGTQFNPPVR